MSYAIFAAIPSTGLSRVLEILAHSGFRPCEVSLLSTAARALTAPLRLLWRIQEAVVYGQGPVSVVGSRLGTANFGLALQDQGMPAYAVRHCERVIERGQVLVGVHTDNGFEIESVVDLLRDAGCQPIVVVDGSPATRAA